MAGINDVSGVCVGGVLGHIICTGLAGTDMRILMGHAGSWVYYYIISMSINTHECTMVNSNGKQEKK